MRIFAVYDKKAGEYLPIFTAKSNGVAIRMLLSTLTYEHDQTGIAQYPEDYRLDYLGSVDMESGNIVQPQQNFEVLVEAASLIQNKEELNTPPKVQKLKQPEQTETQAQA